MTDNLTIRLNANSTEKIDISVFAIDGRVMSQNKYDAQNNEVKLNTSSLKDGIYFIKIKQGDKTTTQQFSKF